MRLEGSYGPIVVIPPRQLKSHLTYLLLSHIAYEPSPVSLVVTGEGNEIEEASAVRVSSLECPSYPFQVFQAALPMMKQG